MSDEAKWTTTITDIKPNKILLRGYPLDELMGKISYAQVVYLILKGELPSENVGKIIDAMLLSSIDHGVTPPSALATMTVTSTGAPINAAISAGILAISEFHGGAIEECMRMLISCAELEKKENLSILQSAEKIVQKAIESKKPISGLGHRIHTDDPRTKKLFEMATECKINGEYIEIIKTIESAFEKSKGKKLPINVDGAIAAILCELGFDPILANAFFIIARVPGLVAHFYEEKTTQKPMRKIDPSNWIYNGPEERHISS